MDSSAIVVSESKDNDEKLIKEFSVIKENEEVCSECMDCFNESSLPVELNHIKDISKESKERLLLRKSMVDHLCRNNQVFFKSSKKDEGELSEQEKMQIVENLLDRNYGLFLAKFGNHLLKEHLCYFDNRTEEESVIVDLHLIQLKKSLEKRATTKKSSSKAKVSQ